MKLEDITYRHELIERYLDADTSVEEEQALADFYRHCEDKDLTDEDLDIRNLMLGMENYTPTHLQPASKKHETRWVRLSAILLATAMLAGLIFLLFPIKDYFSSSSEQPGFSNLVPTEQVVRSQPSSEDENENLDAYEKMERADSLFMAATKDIVTPQEMKTSKMVLAKRKNIAGRSEKHAEKTADNTEETFNQLLRSTKQDGYASLQYFLLRRCWQASSSCSSLSRIISHPLPNNNLVSPTWFLQSRWFARSHLLKMKTGT